MQHRNGCYRCTFNKPPPIAKRRNCSDDGVLGPIPAIIGSMQALEVIKLCSSSYEILEDRLLQFDGTSSSFHAIKLGKNRRKTCQLCGPNPTIKNLKHSYDWCVNNSLIDSACLAAEGAFSGERAFTELSCHDYVEHFQQPKVKHLLVDVRETVQVGICSLTDSINIPLKKLKANIPHIRECVAIKPNSEGSYLPIVLYCRRGVDSKEAAHVLANTYGFAKVYHLRGGLVSWAQTIDNHLPIY